MQRWFIGSMRRYLGNSSSNLCILLPLQHCVKTNKTVAMGAGEQQLGQQVTDWDVDRPHWPLALPGVAPGLSPTDTPGHFLCASVLIDTHSSRWVFTATCWFLLICFLSGQGGGRVLEGLCWTGRPLKVGKTFTHNLKATSDRLHQAWTSFYTEQMWSPTCFP